MWFVGVALALSLALNVGLGFLLKRAVSRLLQFDDVFQGIIPVLDEYSGDLAKMSSAEVDGLLAEHPEVRAFHRRNVRARRDIESVRDSVVRMTPRRQTPRLPRPDME